jgi:hypothetical protein
VADFFYKNKIFFPGNKEISVKISTTVPRVLKTDGQFRFLSPWAVPGDRFKLFDTWSQALSKGFTVKEPFKMSI